MPVPSVTRNRPSAYGKADALIAAHRAATRVPRLRPLFPITPYTPQSVCHHPATFRRGSLHYCVICQLTAYDGPLALDRLTSPEPKPEPEPGRGTVYDPPRDGLKGGVSR